MPTTANRPARPLRAESDQEVKCFGIGILNDVDIGPPIVEYLERIDDTLAPFDGHFAVHGADPQMLEGSHPGAVVIIEFPSRHHAEGWWASDAYQAIVPLRAQNSISTIFLIDGVDADHRATDVLDA